MTRVRLNSPAKALARPAAPYVKRVRLAAPGQGNGPSEPLSDAITPEALAYALPGGLAKLAYPKWVYGPHLKYIEDRVLQILNGKSVFLAVSTPPRHGKTVLLSRVLPAFFLGRFPDNRVMLITHHTDFSRTQSRAARNIIQAFGQKVFGVSLRTDTHAASEWDLAGHTGGMEAIGAGGSVMGKGAHLLLMDDLVKGFSMATNVLLMEKQWEWFLADVYPRLEPGGSAIVTMTRWSGLDVIGQIERAQKEEGIFEEWEIVNLPALSLGPDGDPPDPLEREKGACLFPQRFNERALGKIKQTMDDTWWEALYQGNPMPARGDIINPEWFGRYKGTPQRKDYGQVVISADTAAKETELADYSVLGIFGVNDDQYDLLDVIRDKIPYPELEAMCVALNNLWRPDFFLIEDKGSGTSLIQSLRGNSKINVWPIDPGNENKVLRAQAETPRLRAGVVRIPEEPCPSWVEEFLMEARAFPRGRKDQIDMLSQFLKFMRESSSGIQMF